MQVVGRLGSKHDVSPSSVTMFQGSVGRPVTCQRSLLQRSPVGCPLVLGHTARLTPHDGRASCPCL